MVTETTPSTAVDFAATLPTKRMAAGALFFNSDGAVLLVNPTYKNYWEIPGGAIEANESPYAACCREITEELGLTRQPTTRLLAVDWVPPRESRTEGLIMIFDGGELNDDDIARITVPPDELRGYAFCTPQQATQRLSPLLGRRLTQALRARDIGTMAYLENGYPLNCP